MSCTWKTDAGTGRFEYLDTAREGGGMTIELEHDPGKAAGTSMPSGNEDPFTRITQYAFVVRDVRRVSGYYERIGLGSLPIDHNVSLDRVYRGQPGKFEMLLGWGRRSDVVFEWIQPLVGPNVYEEHLERHGEGFHHLGPLLRRPVETRQSGRPAPAASCARRGGRHPGGWSLLPMIGTRLREV